MNTKKMTLHKSDFRPILGHEPDWLYHRRHESWNTFTEGPLPDRVVHLWRYTKPEFFLPEKPDLLMESHPTVMGENPVNAQAIEDRYAAMASRSKDNLPILEISPDLNNTGLILSDLHSATVLHNELTEPYLGNLIGADFGKFNAQI